MSDAFTNFLGGVVGGIFDSADLKDYQHADRLYVREKYARAPKVGFLYFVVFNFDSSPPAGTRPPTSRPGFLDQVGSAVKSTVQNIKEGFLSGIKNGTGGAGTTQFDEKFKKDIGFLVKAADLPKITIATETINQYNRKTVVQTGVKYNPVSFTFHDDNSNISNSFWINYFQYYYTDSNYGTTWGNRNSSSKPTHPPAFTDTKFGNINYAYGYNFNQKPYISSIDIYVLHQGKFTQYTLINPKITDWTHDSVSQDESNKILTNKMTVAYETVLYNTGKIQKGAQSGGFTKYYDKSPSPLSIGGNGTNSLFGENGIINGAGSVFGSFGEAMQSGNPLDFLGAAIQAKNVAKSVRQLSKGGLKQEGYSILSGVLGDVAAAGRSGAGTAISSGVEQRAGVLGNIAIGFNSLLNSSVNGTTKAKSGPGGG